MQRIYSENPPPFHMYNLTKLEACSEPSQIHKVDLSAIAVFSGFMSLTVSQKAPPQMLGRALNTPAFAFWSCFNEVVDLICSGNVLHMFAPKALKLLFPNLVVF